LNVLVFSNSNKTLEINKAQLDLYTDAYDTGTDYDFFILLDAVLITLPIILQNPEKVIIHEDCFNQEAFKNLSFFRQVFYKNHFEGIICKKKLPADSQYPKVILQDQIYDELSNLKTHESYRINEHILLTNHENKNFILYNAPLFSRFKKISTKKYSKLFFWPSSTLTKYLAKNKIDRVLFNLPYKHIFKYKVLKRLQRLKFPYLILERGALPGCLTWDDSDFNYNSKYYGADHWDKHYTQDEILYKDHMVNKILAGESLEKQSSLTESLFQLAQIKQKAGQRKIIFVPLQRPNDSVINYFCPLGYGHFIKSIVNFAQEHKGQYLVVIKKHPLEKKWPTALKHKNNSNIILINNEAHINELIKISSAVALINSGVGVLSLIFEKPVFYFGQVFYDIKGCNESFKNSKELYEKLNNLKSINSKNSDKFLTYLYNRYYSVVEYKPTNGPINVLHDEGLAVSQFEE